MELVNKQYNKLTTAYYQPSNQIHRVCKVSTTLNAQIFWLYWPQSIIVIINLNTVFHLLFPSYKSVLLEAHYKTDTIDM